MKHFLLLGAVLCALPFSAGADTVRPAVGKPLLQAEALMQKGDYHAALLKVNQASGTAGLTPYESLVTAQLRGAAAAGAGDYAVAASSYQTVLASGTEQPAVRLQLTQAIAGFYYQEPDYPQAITWVNKYLASGGTDERTRALLAQSYYNQGNYAQAEHAVQQQLRAKQPLPESQLQILATSAEKTGDQAGYQAALEALLAAYPSPADRLAKLSRRSQPGCVPAAFCHRHAHRTWRF
jgi:predicted Zn-dependent protease